MKKKFMPTLVFMPALILVVSAHGMSPDVPKKSRSCEERFIDAFVACSQSKWCVAGFSRVWQGPNYERCIQNSSAEERASGRVKRKEICWPARKSSYSMPKFTAINHNQTLEGELRCSRVGDYYGKIRCAIWSSCHENIYRDSFVPIHHSIYPALEALHEVQKQLIEEQYLKEEKEEEKNMMRHQPRS